MRVAAVLLSFFNPEIIRRTIVALQKHEPEIDIFVLENRSENSEMEILPLLNNFIEKRAINGYAYFKTNSNNNAFLQLVAQNIFDLRTKYDYILASDGDIEVSGPFVENQINTLIQGKFFSCALRVDLRSFGHDDPVFEAMARFTAPLYDAMQRGENHVGQSGPFHMRLFKIEDFYRAMEIFIANGFRLRDGLLDKYVETRFGATPAILLNPPGLELTHALMTHEYSVAKRQTAISAVAAATLAGEKTHLNLYNHDLVSDVEVRRLVSDEILVEQLTNFQLPVTTSPEVPTSAFDHPLFAAASSGLRSAVVARGGKGVARLLSEGLLPNSFVLAVASRSNRAWVEPDTGNWIVPIRLAIETPSLGLNIIFADAETCEHPFEIREIVRCAARQLTPLGQLVIRVSDYLPLLEALLAAASTTTERIVSPSPPSLDSAQLQRAATMDQLAIRRLAHNAGLRLTSISRLEGVNVDRLELTFVVGQS